MDTTQHSRELTRAAADFSAALDALRDAANEGYQLQLQGGSPFGNTWMDANADAHALVAPAYAAAMDAAEVLAYCRGTGRRGLPSLVRRVDEPVQYRYDRGRLRDLATAWRIRHRIPAAWVTDGDS